MTTETRPAPAAAAGLTDASVVYYNGSFMPLGKANVSIASHALHYGTGCFEGIRGYWDEEREELYILKLPEHVERFFHSCTVLNIVPPFTQDEMVQIIVALVRENGFRSDIYIRPIAFKSTQTIKLTLSALDDAFGVFAFPFGHYAHREGGLRLALSSWRRIDDNAIPVRAKVTGSYVNASLASDAAQRDGYDEALLLNANGTISEASSSNVFLVRNHTLITPAVSEGILEGITRDAVLTLARNELSLPVVERAVSRTEVYVADEVFLSGTGVQIEPVTQIDRRPVGNGHPGPITTRLQKLYAAAVRSQMAAYNHWCTPTYGRRESFGLH